MPAAGRLIALEGIDGCGKSTQARLLADRLGAVLTYEPGATSLGRALRQLLLDPAGPGPGPRAEALLMAADRAQHVDQVVRPALDAGNWVVTDRFSGSTLAYQGWGRGLGSDPLRRVVTWAAGGLEPDLTVLIDVPVAVARARMEASRPDRLERLDRAFHDRVAEGFAHLAATEPRWAAVDGTGTEEEVAGLVVRQVAARLGLPGAPPGGAG